MIKRLLLSAWIVAGISACTSQVEDKNQLQQVRSSSGYSLSVLKERSSVATYARTRVWKVAIADSSGRNMYKDDSSTLVGTLAVYWGWDDRDQAWLYSSDDGAVWRWQLRDGKWSKFRSEHSQIPKYVLPPYAR